MCILNFISQEKTSDGIESEQLIDRYLCLSSAFSGHPTRKVTLTSCSCLFPSCWGLPCRPMLLVYHHKKMTLVPDNAISDFWKVSYLDRMNCSYHAGPAELVRLVRLWPDQFYAIMAYFHMQICFWPDQLLLWPDQLPLWPDQ